MVIAAQTRLSMTDDAFITKDLKASIRALTVRENSQQNQINAHAEAHDALETQKQQLRWVPGVGSQTACKLMASMPELGQVISKQIASFAGLVPHARNSDL